MSMYTYTVTRVYVRIPLYVCLRTCTHRVRRYTTLSPTYSYFPSLPIAQQQTEYRWPRNSKHENDNHFVIVE